jgi:hypothetical protein
MERIQRSEQLPDVNSIASSAQLVFIDATAGLFRAAPWKSHLLRERLIEVTIPDLGVREGAIVMLGTDGAAPGFMLFACRDDVTRFVARTRELEPAVCPSVVALTFHAPDTDELKERIDRQQWRLAAPDAFPFLSRFDEQFMPSCCDGIDTIAVVAIARALPEFVADAQRLGAKWRPEESRIRTVPVQIGEVAISLRISTGAPAEVTDDLLRALGELEGAAPMDHFRRIALEEELLREFAWAAQAREMHRRVDAPRCMFDIAAHRYGRTIASLDEPTFRRALDDVPETIVLAASGAAAFVEALATFFRFMKGTYGLVQADALLRVLGSGAVARLEARIHAVAPAWVPDLTSHAIDLAPPERTDRRKGKRRAK